MKNYKGAVFFDIEIATKDPNSICQLAFVALDEKNNVIKKYNSLIRPFLVYDKPNFPFTSLHHISWNDVKESVGFNSVWGEIKTFFNGDYLVFAHNANFDITCLKTTLKSRGIKPNNFDYGCTYLSLKKIHPELEKFGLAHLAKRNNIYFNHHDALADVEATIKVFNIYFNNWVNFLSIAKEHNYQIKTFL